MINPDEITDYNRTDRELEEFMVFAICAAGKNANTTAKILNGIFAEAKFANMKPIEFLAAEQDNLETLLKNRGIGCYRNRAASLRQLHHCIKHDPNFLRTATVAQLEQLHGIGPKTSRFFIMHSRPNQRLAALDTHILKELKAEGFKVPKSTPSAGSSYSRLEQAFIGLADRAGMSVADYDLMIWKKHRKKAFWPVDNVS